MDNLISSNDLLNAALANYSSKDQNEFSITELLSISHNSGLTVTRSYLEYQLNALVSSGKASVRKIVFNGHRTRVFKLLSLPNLPSLPPQL